MKPLLLNLALSRRALVDTGLVVAVAAVLTVPFWLTDLDLQAAGLFYHPHGQDTPWPQEHWPLWRFFYKAVPILVNVLLLACLGVLAFTGNQTFGPRLRRQALFVLFSLILGPGLVVNGVFKDHYGRPRPRQVEQFQGHLAYQPPGLPGAEGKSFPCGHCSVGFTLWVFYFIARRRRPYLAAAMLALAVALGVAIGVGRMAAGGHFLSDVIWSALLSYAVCALLYPPLLGKWEDTPDADVPEFWLLARWRRLPGSARRWLFAGLAALLTAAALLATPYKSQGTLTVPLPALADGAGLAVRAAVGDVLVRQDGAEAGVATVRWQFRGFGFPTSHVKVGHGPGAALVEIVAYGLFTDIEGRVEVTLPARLPEALDVEAAAGAVLVAAPPPPRWRLRAAHGVREAPAAAAERR